ncbi:MAG TPA: hypothetical protein ENO08_07245, partial [Candidatus Eisenbacteria bacterium]|nr:hypothetical protein [Candidatus Eisenbacteria bacterium]
MTLAKGIRKTLKALAWSAAAVAAVPLIATALFFLRPVREKALDEAVSRVRRALPGEISITDSRWPAPGAIEIDGLTWTEGGDTLASLSSLRISVDLYRFFRRDVHVRELIVRGISADIPEIASRFLSPADNAASVDKERGGGGNGRRFPREGSLDGVPSIAVDRMEIYGGRVSAAEGIGLDGLRLRCSLDLRRGSSPTVSIDELTLAPSSSPVSTDSFRLKADLAGPSIRGKGIFVLPHGARTELTYEMRPDSSFALRIVPSGAALSPSDAFVSIEGRAAVDGLKPVSVDLEAQFLTPGIKQLAGLPFLAGALEGIGDLEGVRGVIDGHLDLSPVFSASAGLRLESNSYLDTLYIAGGYRPGTVEVDRVVLRMPGLTLDASGSMMNGRPDLSAYIRADSMAWLSRVMPGTELPDGTSAELRIEAGGPRDDDDIPFLLAGHAASGGSSVDSIRVSGTIPDDRGNPVEADLLVDTYGIRIVTRAAVDLSDGIALALSHPEPAGADTKKVYLAGGIKIDRESGKIVAEDLRADGMFGRLSVSAEMYSSKSGRFEILGDWPAPPPVLKTAVSADSAAWDSITALWAAEGPFEMRIGGTVSGGGRAVTATGSAWLPGPHVFSPILAKGDALEGLGPLALDLNGAWEAGDSGGSIEGRVDLGRTGWIDTALVSFSGSGGNFGVDTLLLVFEGLRMSAQGGISGEDLDCHAEVSLIDSLLIRRLEQIAGRNLSLTLDAECSISGKKDAPSVSIGAGGKLSAGGISIPEFT